MCSAKSNVRFTPESGHGRHPRAGAALIRQIDGRCASATMRGLPCPLQRGHCTSRSATRIEASVARLNAQVEIDDAVAAVAGNDQPVMFGNERGGDLRPEPSLPLPYAAPASRAASARRLELSRDCGGDGIFQAWDDDRPCEAEWKLDNPQHWSKVLPRGRSIILCHLVGDHGGHQRARAALITSPSDQTRLRISRRNGLAT